MYGGRVEASKLYWEAGHTEERANYVDMTSLYPTVNFYDKYPKGHHTVIKSPSMDAVKNREYFQ
jgi:hypothetical protein